MAKGKRRGTGTVNEVIDVFPTKKQKTISISKLTGEDIKELPDI